MVYPARTDIIWKSKASRVELIIRFLYAWVLGIFLTIWGFFVGVAWVIHWIYILAMGKRQRDIHDFIVGFWRFFCRSQAYILMLTDERPPITGKRM